MNKLETSGGAGLKGSPHIWKFYLQVLPSSHSEDRRKTPLTLTSSCEYEKRESNHFEIQQNTRLPIRLALKGNSFLESSQLGF